jgi:DNA polymerase III delta prime subunit
MQKQVKTHDSTNNHQFFTSKIFVVDNLVNSASILTNFLEKSRSKNKANQLVHWLGDIETPFSIDEVRKLQAELTYGRPPNEEWLFVIQNGDQIGLPAQQAMLKILEEPPAQTHVCIITTQPELLLPTILSRCELIPLHSHSDDLQTNEVDLAEATIIFEKISQASYSELVNIAGQYKERSDGKILFLLLQNQIYQRLKKIPTQSKLISQLQHLQNGLNLLQTNVNLRILIEQTLFKIKQSI